MTRLQELAGTLADYTIGSIIVLAYMTTAQLRGGRSRERASRPAEIRPVL